MKATSYEINNVLDVISGLRKFHFDVHLFLLAFVHVKYIWMFMLHARPREVFKTVKLLSASL